ncbi:(2Fe-2S)-binding protein [Chryseolinea sp. T2]|uniref:(2Fe-2S)-binding protein n=1 Tax=Chryseolinea sp. T2 TaxID=3129255 RepID=UPI00307730B5
MSNIQLTINGVSKHFDVDSTMPLLWVIRDFSGLMGTKYGCGVGQCGACTIHINGKAVRSCSITVGACAGKPVTTIEGLSSDGTHPLQTAWADVDVPQCGYCQAGQIMTAAAFLDQHPDPSDDEITSAMNGNLCRCGTYPRIHEAVKRASQKRKATGSETKTAKP